jgi:hypothetical protein
MLIEIADKLRNAERLHLSQFDNLAFEIERVAKLNVLDLPEVSDVVAAARVVVQQKRDGLSDPDRVTIAVNAESAADKATSIIDELGL